MEQSYSEGEPENDSDTQPQEAGSAEHVPHQQLSHENIIAPCEKAQSEPNLTVKATSLNLSKTSQSVQTLFPSERKRFASEPELQLQGPSALAAHLQPPVHGAHSSSISVPLQTPPSHLQAAHASVSASHVSLQQAYSSLTSQGPNTLQTSSGLCSQPLQALESQIQQYTIPPPSITFTQVSSSQPVAHPPMNMAPSQYQPIPQPSVQQPLPPYLVSQPAPVIHVSQPLGAIPNLNVPFPVTPIQPMTGLRSRLEGSSFPYFTLSDPHEFVMLKMALTNLLPADEPELYKYHIFLDHLHLPTYGSPHCFVLCP